MNPLKDEPAVTISGAITGVVIALLGLLVGFGVNLTPGQVGLIVGLVGAVITLVTSLVTRSKVTPYNPEPPAHPEV